MMAITVLIPLSPALIDSRSENAPRQQRPSRVFSSFIFTEVFDSFSSET